MLIKGEDKKGFLLNEGKSADGVSFFSTEVCSIDFHQGSVAVLEFSSAPATRVRLLSDKGSSIKKDQVSNICSRGLAQGNFLEESDGDVGGMPQRYQGDEPMSESNSGVTNELPSRSPGLKVIDCVHTSEHMEKKGNTKALSEQTSGALVDAKTSLLNYENIDRYAGSTNPLIQQDVGDTISTSDDDGLFVIQMRSPNSQQLLHYQKQGIEQEELHSCDGAASSQTTGKEATYGNSETLLYCSEGERIVDYCSHKSVIAKDDEKAKFDAEEVDSNVEVSNIAHTGADTKLDTCRVAGDRLISVPATDLGTKNDDGSKYDQQVESLRVRSDVGCKERADADQPIACGAKSPVFAEISTSLGGEVQSAGAVSLDNGDQFDNVIQKSTAVRLPDTGCGEEPEVNLFEPHPRESSHGPVDMTEKSSGEEPGVNSFEIPKVYVRTRKQSTTQVATGAAALQEHDGSSESKDALNCLPLEGEDPLGESIIKHYVRRPPSRANSHGPADKTEKSSGLMTTSATNVSTCSPQAEHHKDMSSRVETEDTLNVFHRRSKTDPSEQDLHENDNFVLQEKATETHSVEACYIRADHQPRWLPEGWTLEIRIREGKKTPARIRDKYYHDQKSGHRFRSRNEVLQYLEYQRLGKDRMASNGIDRSVQLQDEQSMHRPIAPAEHTGFQSSLSKSPFITQTVLGSLAAPNPSFTHLYPTCMNTIPARPTPAVSTEANQTAMTSGYVEGPNGSIQLPWGPRGGDVAANTGQEDQGDKSLKDGVALALDGAAANSSQILKSREGDRLTTGSPIPPLESPGDQGAKANRGKLILRLKRKQPDSDGGKGKSKRPTYEVVHVERTPPSASTPTQQEKLTLTERTGQGMPSTPAEEPSPIKDISYERSRITPPSMALDQPKLGFGNATISNHWDIKQNPQHLEVFQEPYTALGIPATARTSGLQTMASYSANHTHVFLDPIANTIPLSWQYPFANQGFTSVASSVPTFGPFPSVSATFSIATSVPIPVFEHFSGVSSSIGFMQMNATATTLITCSQNRSRDYSVNDVEFTKNAPQIQKALTVPRALTKVENSKLLLGLGRRLCKLAGLEHKKRDWSMQSRPLATSLEGKGRQQRV